MCPPGTSLGPRWGRMRPRPSPVIVKGRPAYAVQAGVTTGILILRPARSPAGQIQRDVRTHKKHEIGCALRSIALLRLRLGSPQRSRYRQGYQQEGEHRGKRAQRNEVVDGVCHGLVSGCRFSVVRRVVDPESSECIANSLLKLQPLLVRKRPC